MTGIICWPPHRCGKCRSLHPTQWRSPQVLFGPAGCWHHESQLPVPSGPLALWTPLGMLLPTAYWSERKRHYRNHGGGISEHLSQVPDTVHNFSKKKCCKNKLIPPWSLLTTRTCVENSVTFHSTPIFQTPSALQEGRNEDRVWAGSHPRSGFGSNTIWLCDPKQNTHSVPQFCHVLNDYTWATPFPDCQDRIK